MQLIDQSYYHNKFQEKTENTSQQNFKIPVFSVTKLDHAIKIQWCASRRTVFSAWSAPPENI